MAEDGVQLLFRPRRRGVAEHGREGGQGLLVRDGHALLLGLGLVGFGVVRGSTLYQLDLLPVVDYMLLRVALDGICRSAVRSAAKNEEKYPKRDTKILED